MDIILHKKEKIVVDNQHELDVGCQEEEQIYPMNGIKVDKGFYTIFELKRRYDAKEKRIILDSDFQRESIWNLQRKAELVESVLMGLPLPIFYFNQDRYGRLIVVDGRQRLTALFEYMDDKFALNRLKILSELNGRKFSDLPALMVSRLEDYQLQAHVILPPTPDRIKFDIFDRVNRGGMQLNKQEIRNALYQGEATLLLNRLAECEEFEAATGGAFLNEKRMKDKYLLNRFIACSFYQDGILLDVQGNRYVYRDDIDELLGNALELLNRMPEKKVMEVEKVTKAALRNAFFYLGGDAFRLNHNGRRTPINMNVFETVMCVMAYVPQGNEEIRYQVKEKISEFLDCEAFRENIGNHRDSTAKLEWRLKRAEELGKALGNDNEIND